MARIKTTGFEVNSVTNGFEWSTRAGTAVQVQSSVVYGGKYAALFDTTGGAATSTVTFQLAGSDQSTNFFYRFMFRVATLPAANAIIGLVRNAANGNMSILRVSTTGAIVVQTSAAVTVATSTTLLALDTWYQIEFSHDASTDPGTLTCRISDVAGNLLESISGANAVQGSWDKILIGNATTTTAKFYIDDFIANDTSGSLETSWVGNQGVVCVRPQKTGDANAWLDTAAAAGTEVNRQLTFENPPDDATTMVQSVTLDAQDMYGMQDTNLPAGVTITCVTLNGRHRNNTADATTAFKYQIRKAPAGTTSQSAALIPNSTTWRTNIVGAATVEPSPLILHQDPDAVNWTVDTVNAMQCGVILSAANVNRIQVTGLWAYVTYTVPALSRTAITQARQTSTSSSPAIG